ncbi:hypothetical protein D3C87_1160250 [compost metagenome]
MLSSRRFEPLTCHSAVAETDTPAMLVPQDARARLLLWPSNELERLMPLLNAPKFGCDQVNAALCWSR